MEQLSLPHHMVEYPIEETCDRLQGQKVWYTIFTRSTGSPDSVDVQYHFGYVMQVGEHSFNGHRSYVGIAPEILGIADEDEGEMHWAYLDNCHYHDPIEGCLKPLQQHPTFITEKAKFLAENGLVENH